MNQDLNILLNECQKMFSNMINELNNNNTERAAFLSNILCGISLKVSDKIKELNEKT